MRVNAHLHIREEQVLRVNFDSMSVIRERLKKEGAAPGQGLRVVEKNGGLALVVDNPRDGDQVVRYFGSVLVMADPSVNGGLGDVVVESSGGPDGSDLSVRRALSQ
ncbi:MAG: hypothetical protein Q8P22_08230 [Chloroflexota bacterium]|nr:hypothetical protein [Chloroflexota bacterium]